MDKVTVTFPDKVSALEGAYTEVKAVVVEKVPDPPEDHNHAVAIDDDPDNVTSALFAQTEDTVPASTVGASVKVIVTLSVIGTHNPTPVEVNVSTMVPAPVSAIVGVY